MENIKCIMLVILATIVISFGIFYGIDREVARRDYNKNVLICQPIDGCLFNSNCNKYNKMIEKECE